MTAVSSSLSILVPIVAFAYTINATIGFGAPLVAVSIGAAFIPVDQLIPILIPLSVILPTVIAVRHRKLVSLALLTRQILPVMGAGMVTGLFIYPLLKGFNLKAILGGFVLLLSIKELLFLCLPGLTEKAVISRTALNIWQFAAGIVHGVYTTGGPLLVYSVSRLKLDKGVFRSTLSAVWGILNLTLMITFFLNGRITQDSLAVTAPLIFVLPVGIFVGERLHRHASPKVFKTLVYCLLICAGINLLIG